MTVFGYAKVSPHTPAGVLDELGWWLRWYGCEQVISDVGQGRKPAPGWQALLERVTSGDLVMLVTLSVSMPKEAINGLLGTGVMVNFLPSPFSKAS